MTRAALTMAVVLGALTLDRLALSTEPGARLLTPSPERTVQTFVTSVATGRPDQARHRLTSDARSQWSSARLLTLNRAWHARDGDYRMRDGEARRLGDRVEIRARIDTALRGAVERTFGLEREAETALWRIARIPED
jgi:hypothetical protein